MGTLCHSTPEAHEINAALLYSGVVRSGSVIVVKIVNEGSAQRAFTERSFQIFERYSTTQSGIPTAISVTPELGPIS